VSTAKYSAAGLGARTLLLGLGAAVARN